MSKDEIVLIQTEMGVLKGNEISDLENILSGLGIREILDQDIVIYQSEIDSLVKIEMHPGSHNDFLNDYENPIEFYLSNVNESGYLQTITIILDDKRLCLHDNKELLIEIQELVVDGIKTEYAAKEEKIKELEDEVRDILENVCMECGIVDDICFDGDWYVIDYPGEFPIMDETLYKKYVRETEKASILVKNAIRDGLIEEEGQLKLW